jgi:hypothetical protein
MQKPVETIDKTGASRLVPVAAPRSDAAAQPPVAH